MQQNRAIKIHFLWLVIILPASLFFGSCNPTRYLSADQKLYSGAKIIVHDDSLKSKTKSQLKENLILLNRQKVNKNIALNAYYKLQSSQDSTGFNYWWYNLLKEEPEFFDTLTVVNVVRSMTNYLKRSGYFQAHVTYETKVKDKSGSVIYHAFPGKSYTFQDLTFEVLEPKLANFLAPYWEDSKLKNGEIVSDNLYQEEKTRVVSILKNNGFYFFDPSMISPLIADSIGSKINATFLISESRDPEVLTRYRLGRINIHSDFDPNFNMLYRLDTVINDYRFLKINKKFKVKPSTVLRYIYIKKGDYYSKENFDRTFRQLNRLGLYRYVNIKESRDDEEPDILNVDILLPQTKTLNFSYNFDINRTNLKTGVDIFSSFALQLSLAINKRNLFNGGEALHSNIDYGIERSFKKGDNYINRQEIRLKNTLAVPRFMDYLGIMSGLSKIKTKKGSFFEQKFLEALDDRVTSNVGLDFEFVNFEQWYRYFSTNTSYGFLITQDAEHQYKWDHLGISFFVPQSFINYERILDQNKFLENSFKSNRLFTGFLLRNFEFNYNKALDVLGQTQGANVTFEMSGFEINALNKIFDPKSDWKLFRNVEFSKYWKLSVSGSKVQRLTDNIYGAAKLTLGAAHSFGSSSSVPYIKQFEIGGPFSIRAWPVRQLGPGSYRDSFQLSTFPRGPYYQTGDIKMELVSEIRFPIYYVFKGAIFLDAGNVWSWDKNDNRPGAMINWGFLSDVAIGSGFGLRMDLKLFILRLDMGTQIKNPYSINGREYFPNRSFHEVWTNLVWNIAVNYPF